MDAAFNLESIETAQNVRQLGTEGTITIDETDGRMITLPSQTFISDLKRRRYIK